MSLVNFAANKVLEYVKLDSIKNDPRLHIAKLALGKEAINAQEKLEDIRSKAGPYENVDRLKGLVSKDLNSPSADFLYKGVAKLHKNQDNESLVVIGRTNQLIRKLFAISEDANIAETDKAIMLTKTINLHNLLADLGEQNSASDATYFAGISARIRKDTQNRELANSLEDKLFKKIVGNEFTPSELRIMQHHNSARFDIRPAHVNNAEYLSYLEKRLND